MRTPDKRLARRAYAPARMLVDPEKSDDYAQHKVLAVQAKHQENPLIHHVVITTEKTYSSIEPGIVPPIETTLKAMHETSPTDCSAYCSGGRGTTRAD